MLLAAAEDLFTRKGFSATTMDDVASAAGMSKKTLYKLFASKTDMFRALIPRPPPHMVPVSAGDDAEPPLAQIKSWLRRIASVALSPREIALQRLIVRETLIAPDLAVIFADLILNRVPGGLVESVKRATLRPHLRDRSPSDVADMLIAMTFGGSHFRLMISDACRLDDSTLIDRIDLAVALFCVPDPEAASAEE